MQTGKIFVIAGPSGAGKATLIHALLAAEPQIALSISYTSRAPRDGEVDGVHYHFVNRDVFLAMVARGEFLEHAEVHGHFYGTSHLLIEDAIRANKEILLELDVQGAEQVRKKFTNSIGIFILPPSVLVLEQRLRGRATDSEAAIVQRLANAREEMARMDEFEYLIINEHVDTAVRDVVGIVRAERCRYAVQAARHAQLIASLRLAS